MEPGEQREQVYAIVRIDVPGDGAVSPDWRNIVTVKGILRSLEAAKAETERLNSLNSARGCVYFWQMTRLLKAQGGPDDAG
jgi:hypothetical protein